MIIFKHHGELKKYLQIRASSKSSIGFVPTMGALHDGHLSLLKKCRNVCNISVCSIFVNPTQFNNQDDFKKYPKTTEKDILILEENGCDVLFLPDEKEIYPDKSKRKKHFDLGYLETILEGKFRPGHFQGVCQVVEKLLNIVEPDLLFLGQKDFQQCLVIKKLIELMQKNIQLIICPILREESGLAMSSRNLRLNSTERKTAAELHRTLVLIKNNFDGNNFLGLKNKAIKDLENKGFKVEYLELAKKNNLELVPDFKNKQELIILISAFLNDVRLIDNLLINP
jgi:pantoate--beta-alanine ligase